MDDLCPKCGFRYSEEMELRSLRTAVKEFFTILDSKEESESGREFSPVQISSCRVEQTHKMELVLQRMKKFGGVDTVDKDKAALKQCDATIKELEQQLAARLEERSQILDRIYPFDAKHCETGKCTKWCGMC